jgi:hypothetical protein
MVDPDSENEIQREWEEGEGEGDRERERDRGREREEQKREHLRCYLEEILEKQKEVEKEMMGRGVEGGVNEVMVGDELVGGESGMTEG